MDELSDSEEDEENAKTERRKQIIERERQQRAQKLGSWKVRRFVIIVNLLYTSRSWPCQRYIKKPGFFITAY